jgi:hypothetical protein
MRNDSADLLELIALSLKLKEIAGKLKREKNPTEVELLISETLGLMEHREEYYYQFSHGGCATGFNFSSAELMNSCAKVRALIKEGVPQGAVEENKKDLISKIREIIRDIDVDSHFTHPNLGTTYAETHTFRETPTYFFSYSHKDKVSKLIAERTSSKISPTAKVWIDEKELKRHQQLPSEISRAIKESTASILVLSKSFLESKWCNHEWQALFMKRFYEAEYRLYLIRIDDVEYPSLLSSFIYTDCRGFPRPEALVELGKLLKEIEIYETYRRFRLP